jgi:DNA-binding XRE family transcriptional regulator
MTQETLAEKADVSPKMISTIERGEINPSLNLMDSIAQGLKIPLAQMVGEAEQIRKKL